MPTSLAPTLLSWASELEPETEAQALRLSRLPFIHHHVALMPDAHLGKGATVGSVVATRGAVVPAAVGVDLGCGMLAVLTSLTRSNVNRESLTDVLCKLRATVPAGVGQGHDNPAHSEALTVLYERHASRGREGDPRRLHPDLAPGKQLFSLALTQLGTLGSGNHFLEVSADQEDRLWVVVHSGSRGVGNKLATQHIKDASRAMRNWFISLDDPDLAYIPESTPHFGRYLSDVQWAQDYAWLNRQTMMRAALTALDLSIDVSVDLEPQAVTTSDAQGEDFVHCHHNYLIRENHLGTDVWVTRKGAVRAFQGDLSVLPGSMGTDTYIVEGLGHPAAFKSAPHGAGRRLSRGRAKRELDLDDMRQRMADRVWLEDDATELLDEHPLAYKDVSQVLADAADLVRPVHTLTPILNYKGV